MAKRFGALLVAFALALLTGCTGEGSASTEPPVSTGAPQSEIRTFPGLGGVMPEMTFNTAEGEVLTLSALLKLCMQRVE